MIQGLYVITDSGLMRPKRFIALLRQVLEGGASIVQYRDKSNQHEQRWQQAQSLVSLCKEYGAVSIINDDVELAKVVQADGVHLGSDDADISEARAELGENKIIGISCYDDIELAKAAEKAGANYVAFGTMFSSKTKPDNRLAGLECLVNAKTQLNIPIVAIGGITLGNCASVIKAGADSVAVISALFVSNDIQATSKKFSSLFSNDI